MGLGLLEQRHAIETEVERLLRRAKSALIMIRAACCMPIRTVRFAKLHSNPPGTTLTKLYAVHPPASDAAARNITRIETSVAIAKKLGGIRILVI